MGDSWVILSVTSLMERSVSSKVRANCIDKLKIRRVADYHHIPTIIRDLTEA